MDQLGTFLGLPPFLQLRVISDALKCYRDFPRRWYRPPDRTPTISASLLENSQASGEG